MAWQRTRIELPKSVDPGQAGELIIEYIRERTQQGTGIRSNGRLYDFPAYSEAYRKWKGQRKVDLTLSEDMLSEMRVLSVKGSSITIGFENGTEANAKAEGNQIGSYGRDPNPRKARSFLGVNKAELQAILAGLDE